MNPYFNANTVLDYVKNHLGSPFNIIELDDNFLVNEVICSHNYLKEFSQYFPKEERLSLNEDNNVDTENEFNKRSSQILGINTSNRWKLDSANEILSVRKVIEASINLPTALYSDVQLYTNPLTYATDNLMLSIISPAITFQFYYPNIIEVYGSRRTSTLLAIIDTVHNKDLSSIPSSLHMYYNKFCLYTAARFILAIRHKYQNLMTPFGEISVNIDFLQGLADKKDELIQEFRHPANFNSRDVSLFIF